jgi:hypothetical protein
MARVFFANNIDHLTTAYGFAAIAPFGDRSANFHGAGVTDIEM